MKKALVTGGAGFIGSHLCEELISSGRYDVYSLDDYSSGKKSNHIQGVNYIQGSTSDIKKLIKFSPDLVFHLGEYSRVEQSFEDIQTVWKSNREGTLAVIEFCLFHGCKIIYAGSSTKFGDGGIGRNQSPYGWSKASNTELVENYGSWFGLPYAIVYFYNAYGPRELTSGRYATVIGIYKNKMAKGESLPLVRPGTQKRNFTHVRDIVNGLFLVGENAYGDEFGIGHPTSYTIKDVVKLFGGEINYLPERRGNRMSAEVVTNKTRALGWSPKYKLEDYICLLKKNNWIE